MTGPTIEHATWCTNPTLRRMRSHNHDRQGDNELNEDLLPLGIPYIGDFRMDDHDRTKGEYADPENHRVIVDAEVIEPQDDALDQFVTMPLRIVIDSMGPRLEVGRYSFDPDDAARLAVFAARFARQFREVPA